MLPSAATVTQLLLLDAYVIAAHTEFQAHVDTSQGSFDRLLHMHLITLQLPLLPSLMREIGCAEAHLLSFCKTVEDCLSCFLCSGPWLPASLQEPSKISTCCH